VTQQMNQSATRTPLDADMLAMLRTSLHHVLTEASSRSFGDRLAELGWSDVVDQDEATALQLLFTIKGETVSPADALGPTLAAHLATVTGDASLAHVTVALASPFGPCTGTGDVITVDAVALSTPGERIACFVDDRLVVVGTAGLTVAPLGGNDEALGSFRVTGSATGATWLDASVTTAVVTRARWLIAAELVGISRHVVAAAVEYTKQRVQYGKPIGVFQALQHRLASAHAMTVGAGRLVTEAGLDGDGWTAMVAKCMAGQTAEHACTQAQQCYGAIGFTWEHEFHHFLRRTYALDRMFGDWRTLEHEIGTRLQSAGTVTRIGSL
jgi:alkylation response protein AidB-like acyl-CoA dehydrogenase